MSWHDLLYLRCMARVTEIPYSYNTLDKLLDYKINKELFYTESNSYIYVSVTGGG